MHMYSCTSVYVTAIELNFRSQLNSTSRFCLSASFPPSLPPSSITRPCSVSLSNSPCVYVSLSLPPCHSPSLPLSLCCAPPLPPHVVPVPDFLSISRRSISFGTAGRDKGQVISRCCTTPPSSRPSAFNPRNCPASELISPFLSGHDWQRITRPNHRAASHDGARQGPHYSKLRQHPLWLRRAPASRIYRLLAP